MAEAKYFLIKGVLEEYSLLNAYDLDSFHFLIRSGIAQVEDVIQGVDLVSNAALLPTNILIPVACASYACNIPGVISSCVAIGIPQDSNVSGIMMEYSARKELEVVESEAKRMVEDVMKLNNILIKEIKCVSSTFTVEKFGVTFAAVLLYNTNWS